MIARVIPLTQTRAIKGLFDYELPPELAEAGVGSLLRVPFSGRTILAVIAEMAATSERAAGEARHRRRAAPGSPAG